MGVMCTFTLVVNSAKHAQPSVTSGALIHRGREMNRDGFGVWWMISLASVVYGSS